MSYKLVNVTIAVPELDHPEDFVVTDGKLTWTDSGWEKIHAMQAEVLDQVDRFMVPAPLRVLLNR